MTPTVPAPAGPDFAAIRRRAELAAALAEKFNAKSWTDGGYTIAAMRRDEVMPLCALPADALALLAHADAQAGELAALREALASLRRHHVTIEDCWYSCPKCDEGCCDPGQGDECNCGADKANAIIDAALKVGQ